MIAALYVEKDGAYYEYMMMPPDLDWEPAESDAIVSRDV